MGPTSTKSADGGARLPKFRLSRGLRHAMLRLARTGGFVRYAMLGPLEVFDGGRRVDVGARKQRAVLAVLLLDTNVPVPLERLAAELWGRERPERATATLQAYVSHLRRALEPDRPPGADPQRLVSRGRGYMLVTDDADIDTRRFERLAADGRQRLPGDPQAARRILAAALALWRGPFLGEFAGEAFAEADAARLAELRAAALEDRIEADLALGAHASAVAELDRLVRCWPLRERLWGLLMVALSRAGRQAEALRAFQNCRRMLNDELGLEPGPGLRQLERDVVDQRDELSWRWPPAGRPSISVAATPIGAAASDGDETALVGRTRERLALEAALGDAWAGRGQMVLLAGEAGIGKTALAEELADRVGAEVGSAVAWGRCHEGEGAPAWWPWSQVLRRLSQDAAASDDGPALAAFEIPARPETLGPRQRFAGNERAANALLGHAAARPCLVVLEDIQWADAASLELLSFLLPWLDGARLLVVATYRDAAVESGSTLANALGQLAGHPTVRRLRPPPLIPVEVGRLIAGMARRPASTAMTTEVWRRSDGNPFFVVELVRLLEAEGVLEASDPAAVDRAGVPDSLGDVIRRRLAGLPEQTQAVLRIAAVAGRQFDLDAVEAVSGLDGDAALEQVELAVMSGVLQEGDAAGRRYRFVHDLVRQVLEDALGARRRARLRTRLAEVRATTARTERDEKADLAPHPLNVLPALAIDGCR